MFRSLINQTTDSRRKTENQIHHPTGRPDEIDSRQRIRPQKRRYLYIKDNIATLKSKKQGYGHPSGMFQKVRPMLANQPTAMDIRKNERQLENVLDDMVEAVISSNSPFCRTERETIQDLNKLQSRLSRTRREKHRKNSAKNRNLRLVRDECHELRQDLKAMEKANYGLEHLNPSVIHS